MVKDVDAEIFEAQADFCKTMGNAARLQILHALRQGPATVKDLAEMAGMGPAAASRQLAVLRSVGVVTARRNRQEVIYQLADPKIGEVCDLVRQVLTERIIRRSEIFLRR